MSEILDIQEPVKEASTPAPPTEPSAWMPVTDEIRNGAPPLVKELLEKKKYDSLDKFFNSYVELEKFKGGSEGLIIPDDPESEQWDTVYNKLGRPETPDKYEIQYEGEIELDQELTTGFKQYAHKLGLTQKQFNDIVAFQIDAVASQEGVWTQQMEEQKQANIQALKEKYGVQFESKIRDARRTADSLGIYQTLEQKGLASDPEIIDMLATIAGRTSEDVIAPQTQTPAKSPMDELKEIKESKAFLNKFDPNHREVMQRFMEVNSIIANSGQSQAPKSR